MSRAGEQRTGAPPAVIDRQGLDQLLAVLARRGFKVIGPTVRDRAIVYGEIASTADLPEGWTDEQEGATYRLHRRDDDALFGFNVGPNSWKSHLFPATLKLWHSRRDESGAITFEEEEREEFDYAFHRGALLRPGRDRGPGPSLRRQRLQGSRLRVAAAQRLHRRR